MENIRTHSVSWRKALWSKTVWFACYCCGQLICVVIVFFAFTHTKWDLSPSISDFQSRTLVVYATWSRTQSPLAPVDCWWPNARQLEELNLTGCRPPTVKYSPHNCLDIRQTTRPCLPNGCWRPRLLSGSLQWGSQAWVLASSLGGGH